MSDALDLLPDDVRAMIKPHMEADPTTLAAIGVQIASKRDEAKGSRSSSGIETTWRACEEAYEGIDAANRHEYSDARWSKSISLDGPVTTGRPQVSEDHRSTVFMRLTSRYVEAATAKLCEILLPADDKAFSFTEMPVPQLIEAGEDDSQVVHSGMNVPLTRPLRHGETPPAAAAPQAPPGAPQAPGAAPQPGRVPLTVRDLANEKVELARKQAKAAEQRIYDWMEQTQFRAEVRKVIGDAARIGVGVLKAPTPRSKRVMAVIAAPDGGVDVIIKENIIPAAVWVDPWNIYPDPACGENIHDGDFVFERDHMSARQVRALKKLPGYIKAQLDQVLLEGPNKINTTSDARTQKNTSVGRFEVWYFYGTLTRDEMTAIDQASGRAPAYSSHDNGEMTAEAHVIVTLINDCVVRATINPLDSGAFPYHSMPWQRRSSHWAGVGVSEQMRAPQKVANASLRALLNNAGKSAGSQFVIDMTAIRPADGSWAITPDKIWEKTNEGPADVRAAFLAIQVPNVTAQLLEIITLAERMAEETTSIPLIAQGQSGATTPDTFGAAQLQNNNANQLLRSIGYSYDDHITEPVVKQMYEWLLLDPDVPNTEKGEFQISAHGSIALVERAIQDQSIAQMGAMAAQPAYGIDPKKWAQLFVKSKRLSPDELMYSKEEQAKLDAAPPPEAPAVTVAKIAADTAMKQLAASQTADQQTQASEERIAAAAHALEGGKAQTAQQKVHIEGTLKAHDIDMQHQRAMAADASKTRIALEAAKVELAKVSMQLQTERDLNAANRAADLHKHRHPQPKPAVQVPGRAANGQAASQSGTPA